MISRTGDNFFAAHYDWIAAGVGALALAGAVAYCFLGGDVEDEIAEATAQISGRGPKEGAADGVDLRRYAVATNVTQVLERAERVAEKADAFFSSERRIRCGSAACGRATPERYDASKNLVCAFCGFTQEVAKVMAPLDADNDGLPDEWETKYGLNPNDASDANADPDGDDFTNLEEYAAKTDPKDPKDHPDYLDSLKITLPLKETTMPFVFRKANKIPTGWRCEFFDPARKDDYGRRGATLTAVIGEEIADSGFVLKSYEMKTEKRAIKGSEQTRNVDVSVAVVERKRDGKKVTLTAQQGKTIKLAAVDVQASLRYERGQAKTFDVVAGSEIVLSGTKYRISEIKQVGKGAKVSVEEIGSRKIRVLEALEP